MRKIAGYCWFHDKWLSYKEVKLKKCRCKDNTKKKCCYFESDMKPKYNNTAKNKYKRNVVIINNRR